MGLINAEWEEILEKVKKPEEKTLAPQDTSFWGKWFGSPKKLYTTKEGEPGFRIETPPGTKALEWLKEEWETDWPEWVGLGITLGSLGLIKGIPALQDSLLTKAAKLFARNNFKTLKKGYPDVIKTVKDAETFAEIGLKQKFLEKTADMNYVQSLSTAKKVLERLSKVKIPAPETQLPTPTSSIAKGITKIVGKTPQVGKAVTETAKFVTPAIDKIRQALAGINIDAEAKEELALALSQGKKPDIPGILGRFFNRLGEEWLWLPREEQKKTMERLSNEIKKLTEELRGGEVEEAIPMGSPKLARLEEDVKGQLWIPGTVPKNLMKELKVEEPPPPLPDPQDVPEGEVYDDVGLGWWIRNFRFKAMDWEQKTGQPVSTQIVEPVCKARRQVFATMDYISRQIRNIRKNYSKEEIARVTDYMRELNGYANKLRAGEITREEFERLKDQLSLTLTPKEKELHTKIRQLYNEAGERFEVPPERWLEEYLPQIREEPKPKEKTLPIRWLGVPGEFEPFFEKARRYLGKVATDLDALDLLQIYYRSGAYAQYRDVINKTKPAVNNLPPNVREEILKWENYLTGGQTDWDKAIKNSFKNFIGLITKGKVKPDRDIIQDVVNLVYMGGMSFSPGLALKNLTQWIHNLSEQPLPWVAQGIKLFFSKEGQEILRKSGIMTGYLPYVSREKGIKGVISTFDRAFNKLRDVGLVAYSSVDYGGRGIAYLTEWARVNWFAEQLRKGEISKEEFLRKIDWAGVHPTIRKSLEPIIEELTTLPKEGMTKYRSELVNRLADALGDYRQGLLHYWYMAEVTPQWMRGGVGKAAGQYATWQTYKAEMHYQRWKRAMEAWQEGKKKEAFYQIFKDLKLLGYLLGAATAARILGSDISSWFKFWKSQVFGPVIETPITAYEFISAKAKGYDWTASKKWWELKNSWPIFVPAGVQTKRIWRAMTEEERPLSERIFIGIGIPPIKQKEEPWINEVFKKWGMRYGW